MQDLLAEQRWNMAVQSGTTRTEALKYPIFQWTLGFGREEADISADPLENVFLLRDPKTDQVRRYRNFRSLKQELKMLGWSPPFLEEIHGDTQELIKRLQAEARYPFEAAAIFSDFRTKWGDIVACERLNW